jgi:hypothetical protein
VDRRRGVPPDDGTFTLGGGRGSYDGKVVIP